jgi:hypothetical protein
MKTTLQDIKTAFSKPVKIYVTKQGRRYVKLDGRKYFIGKKSKRVDLIKFLVNKLVNKGKRRRSLINNQRGKTMESKAPEIKGFSMDPFMIDKTKLARERELAETKMKEELAKRDTEIAKLKTQTLALTAPPLPLALPPGPSPLPLPPPIPIPTITSADPFIQGNMIQGVTIKLSDGQQFNLSEQEAQNFVQEVQKEIEDKKKLQKLLDNEMKEKNSNKQVFAETKKKLEEELKKKQKDVEVVKKTLEVNTKKTEEANFMIKYQKFINRSAGGLMNGDLRDKLYEMLSVDPKVFPNNFKNVLGAYLGVKEGKQIISDILDKIEAGEIKTKTVLNNYIVPLLKPIAQIINKKLQDPDVGEEGDDDIDFTTTPAPQNSPQPLKIISSPTSAYSPDLVTDNISHTSLIQILSSPASTYSPDVKNVKDVTPDSPLSSGSVTPNTILKMLSSPTLTRPLTGTESPPQTQTQTNFMAKIWKGLSKSKSDVFLTSDSASPVTISPNTPKKKVDSKLKLNVREISPPNTASGEDFIPPSTPKPSPKQKDKTKRQNKIAEVKQLIKTQQAKVNKVNDIISKIKKMNEDELNKFKETDEWEFYQNVLQNELNYGYRLWALKKRLQDLEEAEKTNKSDSPTPLQSTEDTLSSLDIENIDNPGEDELGPINLDEPEDQTGGGKEPANEGLYNDEIEDYMQPFKKYGFKGVYSLDEIKKIPVSDKMSFIMNLDPSHKPGSHWVAVNIDSKKDKSVEYYDSYGDEPPNQFLKDIKYLIKKINPDTYLKFKVNKIINQRSNSSNCGFFAMKFLVDRYNNIPFPEASGYSDIMKSEKNIEKFKKKFPKFSEI